MVSGSSDIMICGECINWHMKRIRTHNCIYFFLPSGSIPTEFGLFEDMEILRLGGNLLTGTIPSELADMIKLQQLYLHANE